uniref:Ion_trans domain-containing protein n=1 Tax=Panagrellus redivivus TaxID=6233 RepID=A0A7E4ZT03_PANRE
MRKRNMDAGFGNAHMLGCCQCQLPGADVISPSSNDTLTLKRNFEDLAGKAAAISSAMLTRRKSSIGASGGGGGGTNSITDAKLPIGNGSTRINVARESVAVLAEMLAFDTSVQKAANSALLFRNMCIANSFLKLACIISMISICLHTPDTMSIWNPLQYIVFVADIIVTIIFTVEARSSQQIQNVTIFFLFFMALYAIMGVQLFGRVEYHCVRPGTDPNNVTIVDLAVPDTMCSKKGGGGYECPGNMECMKLKLDQNQQGYYGMFNDFAISGFSVYLAASEEGWVYVLYDCLDSFPSYIAFIYFITLIFFFAWLVKNVFIAVITETFAEIRVQFSEMWQTREIIDDDGFQQRLEKTEKGWRLITVDSEIQSTPNPRMLYHIVRSMSFQTCMMFLVLLNAGFNASFVYYHDESDILREQIYYCVEVIFTIVFVVEAIVKIIGLSWSTYIRRGQHKFEMILCVGTILNVVPFIYETNICTYFQVFRIVRLIKASPMLEDFVYKIFGPGKKLGSLVLFTVIILIISSAISLQLFCFVPHLEFFRTFPQAFMCMFQIITQEGWTDIVVEILRATNYSQWVVSLVAAYFVGYHLIVTMIVLSLFVAVILDNLEMDEELKKIKQLKAREQTTSMRTTLPWRLRIFEKFPTRPQMVALRKINSDFPVPKVRDSFTRQFAQSVANDSIEAVNKNGAQKRLLKLRPRLKSDDRNLLVRQAGQLSSRSSVRQLIERGRKGFNNSAKSRPLLEQLNENGDLRPSDSAPKNSLKIGEIDIKALEQKRAHAEFTRNRIEEEMRENHPFFDRPLFAIGRNSRFRQICQKIVYAKYTFDNTDPVTGKFTPVKYKQLRLDYDFLHFILMRVNDIRKPVADYW